MILGWPPFKIVSGDPDFQWPPSYLWEFPIGFYVKLTPAVVAILVGGMKCRTHFWKRTTQGSCQQIEIEKRGMKFKKIFSSETTEPISTKLCWDDPWVVPFLVEGLNCLTYIWKRTIQWLFHQHLVLIEQMVSDKKIFIGISHRVLNQTLLKWSLGGPLPKLCPAFHTSDQDGWHSQAYFI
jgi:hypothetical protein